MFFSFGVWAGQASDGDVCGSPALHAVALVRALGIVADELGVEDFLHGLDAVVKILAPHDAELLVE